MNDDHDLIEERRAAQSVSPPGWVWVVVAVALVGLLIWRLL